MKIQILEQKKNPLLKREELSVSIEHPGKATPSRREILPELAKVLKSKEELLIIDKIFSVYGRNVSEARILAYKNKNEIPKEKLEKMKGRMMEKKKAAPAEAPAPAEGKPEEAPKEGEAKEEKPESPKDEKPAEEAPAEEKPKEEKPAEGAKPEEKKDASKEEEKA